jgi:hypothetical protein
MKEGDKVTGVPDMPDMAAKHPTVTGFYETAVWEFMGDTYQTEFVRVGDVSISCDEGTIRPAGRRDKETVLNNE